MDMFLILGSGLCVQLGQVQQWSYKFRNIFRYPFEVCWCLKKGMEKSFFCQYFDWSHWNEFVRFEYGTDLHILQVYPHRLQDTCIFLLDRWDPCISKCPVLSMEAVIWARGDRNIANEKRKVYFKTHACTCMWEFHSTSKHERLLTKSGK